MRDSRAVLVWCSLGILSTAGCRLAQDVVEIPGETVRTVTGGKPDVPPPNFVEIQQKVLRFTDGFQNALILAVEHLRREGALLEPRALLQLKIGLITTTTSIASGSDARSNLLDLTVFVTVIRMSVEDHWQPDVYGPSGIPLLEACRTTEAAIWILAAEVLTPAQEKELREAAAAWHAHHPKAESLLAARSVGIASEAAAADPQGSGRSGGVLHLLSIDPLSGLDPAVREIAQARLLAERALFVAQRMPLLVRFQTELLALNALDQPALRQLVANTTQVASSVDRAVGVAEKLPDRVSKEREELVKALESQEKTLRPLVNEAKQALEAGTRLSDALTVTLKALDEFTKRMGLPAPPAPPDPKAEPFRIQDYTQAAAGLEAAAKQLTELIATLERTVGPENVRRLSDQVDPAVRRAEEAGRGMLDRVLRNAVLFVVAVLIAALIYRFVAARLASPSRAKAP